jgi:hypothetical protein
MKFRLLVAALLLGATWTAAAQDAATPAPPAPPAPAVLPVNSAVPLRFVSTVSSGTHTRGQTFDLEVTDDITAGDRVVIPAGSIATGEVIHAERARGLGKAGELILSARYVTVGERRIKLRAQLSQTGQDKTMQAAFLVPWIKGKNLDVPADTEVIARTAADEAFATPL